MADGGGTQKFGNGDRYEGEWKEGRMNGQVIMHTIILTRFHPYLAYTAMEMKYWLEIR